MNTQKQIDKAPEFDEQGCEIFDVPGCYMRCDTAQIEIGEIVNMTSPHTKETHPVEFRGGSSQCCVIFNRQQMIVPREWLSKKL